MPYRVVLVEDHPEVREALTALIELYDDFVVVNAAADAREARDILAQTEADVVIVDISLPGMSGIELTRQLLAREPNTKVLVVSGHEDALYARQAEEAGAKGFVTKGQVVSALIPALNKLLTSDGEFIRA